MSYGFLDIAVTPSVRAAQAQNGAAHLWPDFKGDRAFDRFTENEIAFIGERDSFYIASVSETGWPYVQHRGGPRGFLRVIDDRTLAFADFAGNRQYISLGNLGADARRLADPDGLRQPAAAEDIRACRGKEPRRRSGACGHDRNSRLSRQGGTRLRAPPRCIRLELPAAHCAELRCAGCGAGAWCDEAADRGTGGGERGASTDRQASARWIASSLPRTYPRKLTSR